MGKITIIMVIKIISIFIKEVPLYPDIRTLWHFPQRFRILALPDRTFLSRTQGGVRAQYGRTRQKHGIFMELISVNFGHIV